MKTIGEAMAECKANEDRAPCLSKWRHIKSNGEYVVTAHVVLEATLEPAIIYRMPYDVLTGTPPTWCRPAAEFLDGRFLRLT